jgi:hypothetical protein
LDHPERKAVHPQVSQYAKAVSLKPLCISE